MGRAVGDPRRATLEPVQALGCGARRRGSGLHSSGIEQQQQQQRLQKQQVMLAMVAAVARTLNGAPRRTQTATLASLWGWWRRMGERWPAHASGMLACWPLAQGSGRAGLPPCAAGSGRGTWVLTTGGWLGGWRFGS